ncbi:MAG: PrgI family protein, partial [Candidatus Colwellbacteria bacterium]|nr:PrgI family protein [Candidatus Colwellbacteria bacterium]
QFQVPQFIETEDKVIGPLTWRQFAYIGGAGAISVLLFLLLTPLLWFLLTLIVGGIAVALAIVPVNGRPMIVFLRALFDNIWKPKIYVFQPRTAEAAAPAPAPAKLVKGEYAQPKGLPETEGLKGLRRWLQTSKTALPKRERPLTEDLVRPMKELKERYEIVRRLTGEKEVARRIDYR